MRKPRTLPGDELFRYALGLLGARALAAAEIRSKLLRKAETPADVDAVIARLSEYGFLDDSRFAEGFATARRDSGAFGAARVRRDLRQRMVSPAIADRAVNQAFDGTDETALIHDWLQRKFRNTDLQQYLSDPKKLMSVWRRLRYAGFSSSASVRALKNYATNAAELEESEED